MSPSENGSDSIYRRLDGGPHDRPRFFSPTQLVFLVEHHHPLTDEDLLDFIDTHPAVTGALRDEGQKGRDRGYRYFLEHVIGQASSQAFRMTAPEGVTDPLPINGTNDRIEADGALPRHVSILIKTIPVDPDEGGYKLSHLVRYIGKIDELVDEQLGDEYGTSDPIPVASIAQRRRPVTVDEERPKVLQGVTVNWYITMANSGSPVGGPGSRPVAAHVPPTPRFDIIFGGGCDSLGDGENATVYVLDTVVGRETLQSRGLDNFDLAGSALASPRLVGTDDDFSITPDIRVRRFPLHHVCGPRDEDKKIHGHDYDMRDHGLFVADIVRAVAPKARIEMLEVLDTFGVGCIWSLLWGFGTVLDDILNRNVSNPIVNCSFTMTIPNDSQLPDHVLDALVRDYGIEITTFWEALNAKKKGKGKWWGQVKKQGAYILDLLALHKGIEQTLYLILQYYCRYLGLYGAWVVAAAGNEGSAEEIPPPRYPAADDTVVGVGALDYGGARAEYSNQADLPISQGVSFRGGGATDDSEDNSYSNSMGSDPGLRGVFTQPFPKKNSPAGTDSNATGWAHWSGTSFATPIAAGLLAILRADAKSYTDATDCLKALSVEVRNEVSPIGPPDTIPG